MTQTLINKYRPRKFEDFVGQKAAVAAVQNALERKLSRTFLLTGPPGVGKTSMARVIASQVMCDPSELREVDGATHTGIEAMRALTDTLHYMPLVGLSKVVVIDEAQGLSKAALTSLLKSLEEPPRFVYWILCTTEPTKIPAALKTRSVHVDFKPVSVSVLTSFLKNIAKSDGYKLDDELEAIIDLCVSESSGSPRQALSNFALCADVENADQAAELLRSASRSAEAIDLARILMKDRVSWKEVQPVLLAMKEQNGESIRQVIRAYATTIALKVPGGPSLKQALNVLSAFEQPCAPQDGISPIVLRCGRMFV